MKTCQACGLPAPVSTVTCALCASSFAATSPTSFRLSIRAGRHTWEVDGREVAWAAERDGRWDVTDADTGHVAVSVIPADVAGPTKVALIDHRARLVATFTPNSGDRDGLGLVLDSYERLLMAVRADGPTGTHVIDADGTVLALADRDRTNGDVDILLTGAGAPRTETLVFGVTLALDLLRRAAQSPA